MLLAILHYLKPCTIFFYVHKIYLIFIFFFHGLCCYAQQVKDYEDYCEPYEAVYSVLSNLDNNLTTRLSETDSLIQIVIEEGVKLKREICFNNYCIDSCYNIKIPRSIFHKVSLGKWLELSFSSQKQGIYIKSSIDTIYETQFRMPHCTSVIDPPTYITDACSLHFSSKKSSKGEQLILINGTTYSIAKRKDGTTVLRKED